MWQSVRSVANALALTALVFNDHYVENKCGNVHSIGIHMFFKCMLFCVPHWSVRIHYNSPTVFKILVALVLHIFQPSQPGLDTRRLRVEFVD
jgi:hypothetical protein